MGMGSVNERLRYNVTSSFIGWTENDPCLRFSKHQMNYVSKMKIQETWQFVYILQSIFL